MPRERRGGRWLGAVPSLWAHAFPGTVSGKYNVGMLKHVGMLALTILLVWQLFFLTIILFDNCSLWQLYMSHNCTCLTIVHVWQLFFLTIIHVWQLYMCDNNSFKQLSMRGNWQTIYRHVVYDKIGQKCSQQHEKTCHVCLGHGEVLKTPKHRCPHCQGHRVVPDNQFLTVKILPGEWDDEYLSSSITQPAVLPRQGAWVIHEGVGTTLM